MKSTLLFSFILLSFLGSANAHIFKSPIIVSPDVIYGVDDRMDVYESSDNLMKTLALSTAAQILNESMVQNGEFYTIQAKTLKDGGMCATERFANQMTAANCSGFLVGADLLVTAGHCIREMSDCTGAYWVFDYANTTGLKTSFTFNRSQVYRCTQIISRDKNQTTQNDYALVKLDRPVAGRTPLKVRTAGRPADDAVFTVIGHPTGLPTKITSAAKMRMNTNPVFFQTNADTYGGNSGSAVIDSKTGVVEGILVRGDQDYTQQNGCLISVRRDQDGGRGEDVTRITNFRIPR